MSFDLCICDACKSIRKSKSINLLRCTDVYMCKSWVVSLQWLSECCILVATCAQRCCCRSVYMSKDCVVSSQCMWLRCMYIDLIKQKIDRFTVSCRRVDVQKLNRAFAVYVYVTYKQTHTKRTSYQSTSEQHKRLRTDTKIKIELFCARRSHRKQRCFREVQRFLSNHYLFYLFLMCKTISWDQSLLFWAR